MLHTILDEKPKAVQGNNLIAFLRVNDEGSRGTESTSEYI